MPEFNSGDGTDAARKAAEESSSATREAREAYQKLASEGVTGDPLTAARDKYQKAAATHRGALLDFIRSFRWKNMTQAETNAVWAVTTFDAGNIKDAQTLWDHTTGPGWANFQLGDTGTATVTAIADEYKKYNPKREEETDEQYDERATDFATKAIARSESPGFKGQMSFAQWQDFNKITQSIADSLPDTLNTLIDKKLYELKEGVLVNKKTGKPPSHAELDEGMEGFFKRGIKSALKKGWDELSWENAKKGAKAFFELVKYLTPAAGLTAAVLGIRMLLCDIGKGLSGCQVSWPPPKGKTCEGGLCEGKGSDAGLEQGSCGFKQCCGTCGFFVEGGITNCTTQICCSATSSVDNCPNCQSLAKQHPGASFGYDCVSPLDLLSRIINAIAQAADGLWNSGFAKYFLWIGIAIGCVLVVLFIIATVFGVIKHKFETAGQPKTGFKNRFNKAHKAFSLK